MPTTAAVNQTNKTVTEGQTYGKLPTPSRNGYTFNGWYTDINGGALVTDTTTVDLTDNQTLYAHWSAIQNLEPMIDAPEILEDAISLDVSTGSVIVTIPDDLPADSPMIQNVICAFGDASGLASEYKGSFVAEQCQTIQITPKNKNYRTVRIFTLDENYRPVCKPTIVTIPASD